MSGIEFEHMVYLVLLLVMLLIWYVSSGRVKLSQTLRHAAIWGLIFLGGFALVGMWDDIRSTARPLQTVLADEGRIEIPRSPDGHFRATLSVNGSDIVFIVDTGATDIVLSKSDARRAGFDPDTLPFFGRAMTANGEVRTAPVWLKELRMGPYVDSDVRASVNDGDLEQSLLGMTYLQYYEQITIAGNKLILTR